MPADAKERWDDFFAKLDQGIRADLRFSIVLEDPLANSYVQSLAEEDGVDDAQLSKEYYERTEEEIDELGLAYMKTEGYEAVTKEEEVVVVSTPTTEDGGTTSHAA